MPIVKTFTANSDQLTNAIASPSVHNNVNFDGGRVRYKRFSYTAAAALAASSTVGLCLLPENAVIMGGAYQHSAYGAGRTLDIGLAGADNSGYYTGTTADDADFLINGDDVSASGQDTIAELAQGDLNPAYETTKEVIVYATILGDTFPLAGTLVGFIKYTVD